MCLFGDELISLISLLIAVSFKAYPTPTGSHCTLFFSVEL
jgi:hypothetical protein